ncbi:MAG: diaminopimelate decarboxylase [Planctomycetes bacterium]|nr:diaminopimelate decarboxylase [Planctomycetota bacterium]
MDDFRYDNGVLTCEAVDLTEVAESHGTPLYVYSAQTFRDHYRRFAEAFAPLDATVCFSVKSCPNLNILRLLRKCGASFDVVSGGELARALEAGADPGDIVFAGVGKTDTEIRSALEAGIGWFNVESPQELDNIATIAAAMGKTARVALRVNPDVDPHTHEYTTTGKRENKFGVDIDRAANIFREFSGRRGLELCGIHLHIGSPVNTVEPYVRAVTKVADLVRSLRQDGFDITAINLGGGFGAHYDGSEAPPAKAYADAIVPLLWDLNCAVSLEPGRCIAANAGVLLTRTLYTKAAGTRRFVIVDAAFTDLMRPALYGAFHFAWPVAPGERFVPQRRSADLDLPGTERVDIVGPVCESGDFLAKDRRLPPVARGDLICVFSTGAYGFSMSSQYNSRPRPAEVLVDGDQVRVIRRRETYDDLVEAERAQAKDVGTETFESNRR